MSKVAPEHRNGASALYIAVTSIAGSIAALAAGAGIARFGYPAVLVTCATMVFASVALFRKFLD